MDQPITRECGKEKKRGKILKNQIETPLDPAFYPLKLDEDQDRAWEDIVRANIGKSKEETKEDAPDDKAKE